VEEDQRIIAGGEQVQDGWQYSLRPRRLQEYIGQEKVKENMTVFIQAALKRREALDHVLLYGPPGLGKTTLANIIANELGVNIRITSGPALERQGDLAAILTNLDESEVLSPADDKYHINKNDFKVPFVCGAKDLGEALRRINEGAAMIRTKGEPGTGDVVQAVRHMRMMMSEIRRIQNMSEDELYEAAKQLQVPYNLVEYVHENGKLPVVNFAAGGVATPADAALMMHLGAEGVFVGSGIFKSGNPAKRASAIVQAVTNYTDDKLLAELSEDLGEAMVGINENEIALLMAERGK